MVSLSYTCVYIVFNFFTIYSQKLPPSTYVHQIHEKYLQAICNEKGSSLQGLKYDGGPEHECVGTGEHAIVPYVKFPEEKRKPDSWSWKCNDCLHSFQTEDVDLLLDPKVYAM